MSLEFRLRLSVVLNFLLLSLVFSFLCSNYHRAWTVDSIDYIRSDTSRRRLQSESVCFGDSPFSRLDNTLVFTSPLSSRYSFAALPTQEDVQTNYLAKFYDKNLAHFSMDVGLNRGRVTKDWINKQSNVFVIAVEANHHLAVHFELSEETKDYRDRCLVVHGATATKRGGTHVYYSHLLIYAHTLTRTLSLYLKQRNCRI